jgi:DNA polymerase III subunit delta'
VILLSPAEAMNANTANALLKTLEEPPPETVMLLVSSEPERLLPTVRSRCQSLGFGEPDRNLALKWLEERGIKDAAALLARYGGSPLSAADAAAEGPRLDYPALINTLAAAPDPLALSELLAVAEPVTAVDCLQRWVCDLVMYRWSGRTRYFPAHEAAIAGVSGSAAMPSLLGFSRRLAELRSIAQHPVNPRLFAERLALDYAAAVGPPI